MATENIEFNDALPHGRLVRRTLTDLETGTDGLNDAVDAIAKMIDGTVDDPAHFEEVMTRLGTTSLAKAKALFDELVSLRGKFDTDASVAEVKSALKQAFDKLR